MACIEEIAKVAKEFKDATGVDGVKVERAIRSISQEATNSTYYFPVLVSNSVTQKSAFMISENLQYMYAYFMRACFSLAPAIKVKLKEGETIDVEEYLKRFHKNSGVSRNKYILTPHMESALEDFVLLPNEPLNEATGKNNYRGLTADEIKEIEKEKHKHKMAEIRSENEKEAAREKARDERAAEREEAKDKRAAEKEANSRREDEEKKEAENRRNAAVASWSAGKIEKDNATNPLTVPVTCTFLVDNHELKMNIPVGIKTIVHDLDSREVSDRIISELTNHSLIRNFIRWKSGELESLGDSIFGFSDMKKDISGESELNKWMDVVTRRKILNRISVGALSRKPFLPNMSIVISMDDVDYIERNTKMNVLKQVRYAYKIMKECLLLSFVVVDEANSTAWILYDGHGSFEEVPFSSIKRDSDKQQSAIDRLLKVFA